MKQYSHKSWHNFLDLRLLLVLMVLSVVVNHWRPAFWSLPDLALFEIRQLIQAPVRTPPKVALINLDRPERAVWASFGGSATRSSEPRLDKLLDALVAESKAVGVVLPYPIDFFDVNSGELQNLLNGANAGVLDSLRSQVVARVRTRELLAGNQVVLGISGGRVAGQLPLKVENGKLEDLSARWRNWLWPVHQQPRTPQFPLPTFSHFPVLTQNALVQPLVFQDGSGVHTGFALELLHQFHRLAEDESEAANPDKIWLRDSSVRLGDKYLPLAATGKLVPLVNEYSTMMPSFERLTVSAAMARPVTSSIVLIGSSDNHAIEALAATMAALAEGLIMVEPVWFSPLNKIVLLVLLLVFLLLVPRISFTTGLILCGVLAVFIVALQLVTQMLWQWWLPVSDMVWTLAIGFAVIRVWQSKQSRRLETQRRLRLMSIAHAQRLTELGELEQAQQTLISYTATHRAYQPYIQLAEAFASQGDYQQALNTIAELRPPRDKKQELRQKRERWAQLAGTETVDNRDQSLASTLVMELDSPLVLGRYELKRELGRGAMGTVYLAYDPKIDRKVAIKTLNFKNFEEPKLADIKARFFREAAAAGRLNHPHIVSVFDVGEEENLAFIAMDYVEGQPLSQFVTEANLLEPFEVYRAIAHVARALDYAHRNNIIHRDIKPANIMYSPDPYQLQVADFGIARLVDDSRTSTGEILGSPLYMAPEQLQGKTVTPAADLFSLGVTFYQLLSGQLPFKGDNLASLTYEIIYSKPQSVRRVCPDLPASATRIINRALHKDASRRYESAAEMAEAIEKAMRRDFTYEAKAAGYIVR